MRQSQFDCKRIANKSRPLNEEDWRECVQFKYNKYNQLAIETNQEALCGGRTRSSTQRTANSMARGGNCEMKKTWLNGKNQQSHSFDSFFVDSRVKEKQKESGTMAPHAPAAHWHSHRHQSIIIATQWVKCAIIFSNAKSMLSFRTTAKFECRCNLCFLNLSAALSQIELHRPQRTKGDSIAISLHTAHTHEPAVR